MSDARSNELALDVSGLSVELETTGGSFHVVRSVSLTLPRGEILGIVGETGSGKSMTALSLLGLLPRNARRSANRLRLGNTDLLAADTRTLSSRILGRRIGMIFQEPMTCLNPVYTIGRQLVETMTVHGTASPPEARQRALFLLEKAGISDPRTRMHQYPHQLSGGLRQRVMIAMALMNEPELLIADEPTTALDAMIQMQILDLLLRLRHELGMSMLLISHDIDAIAHVADRIAVMYAGEVIEHGRTRGVLEDPRHPYTRGLLSSIPDPRRAAPLTRLGSIPGTVPRVSGVARQCLFATRCPRAVDTCLDAKPPLVGLPGGHSFLCFAPPISIAAATEPAKRYHPPSAGSNDILLSARGIGQTFRIRRGPWGHHHEIVAVDDIDLDVRRGEILALVGESGCGKTTLSRILLGLQTASAGEVFIDGQPLTTLPRKQRARLVQPVFQDPYASLNPKKTIGTIIAQPLRLLSIDKGLDVETETLAMMERVGLAPDVRHRYPGQLSGGQRQRVAIARALITAPNLVICDEPTSALDVSVQAQVLNLLLELREALQLTYLFITHDLKVVQHIADRVAVMHRGRIVEMNTRAALFARSRHPYTQALLETMQPPSTARQTHSTVAHAGDA